MEIVVHAHHAEVSDYMRQRATGGLEKLSRRLGRSGAAAMARFVEDGAERKVELELLGAGQRFVASAAARHWGPAISDALGGLQRQLARHRGALDAHIRREAATRRAPEL